MRQTLNELTGEHTCVMVKPIQGVAMEDISIPKRLAEQADERYSWLAGYATDFKKRFISLLGFEFRNMSVPLILSILDVKKEAQDSDSIEPLNDIYKEEIKTNVTIYDVLRLESYTKNLVDYHMILDLLPAIAKLYFLGRLKGIGFSYIQLGLISGIGLQYKQLEKLEEELGVGINQLMAMFNKAMRKMARTIRAAHEGDKKVDNIPKKHNIEPEADEEGPLKKKKVE